MDVDVDSKPYINITGIDAVITDAEAASDVSTSDVSGVLDSAKIYIPDLEELSDILEDYSVLRERSMSDDEHGVLSTTKEAKKGELNTMLDDLKKDSRIIYPKTINV